MLAITLEYIEIAPNAKFNWLKNSLLHVEYKQNYQQPKAMIVFATAEQQLHNELDRKQ